MNFNNNEEEFVLVPEPRRGRKAKRKKGDGYDKYPPEHMVTFIEAVEARPVIWDPKDDNWHRREHRMRAFDDVELDCSQFMPRGRRHGQTAVDLWTELDLDFKRHVRRIRSAQTAADLSEVEEFPFARNLLFLAPVLAQREIDADALASGDEVKPNVDELENGQEAGNLTVVTPKRVKLEEDDHAERSQPPKTMPIETNKVTVRVVRREPTPTVTEPCCGLCKVFKAKTAQFHEVDRIIAEAKVIAFINAFMPNNAPPPN